MTVEILLAGVAGVAVLGAYIADSKHRKAKAKAKAAKIEPPRWADAGPVHTPLSSLRSPLPMSMAIEKRQESSPVASASHDDNHLTQMLVAAIVIDSMTPDSPATYDSGSSWSSSDSGSSSYDSGSSSSYDSSSSTSDSGGGGGW
jgi:uncharacterized membrane protein YgcG